jgi:hypothetical protein
MNQVWIVMVEKPTGAFDGSTTKSVFSVCASEAAAEREVARAENEGGVVMAWPTGPMEVKS